MKHMESKRKLYLPQSIHLWLISFFAFEGLIRGIDYAFGDRDDVTESLTIIERAMPLELWGLAFISTAGTIIAGILKNNNLFLIYGSIVNMGLYGALCWGLTLKMVSRGWPWDGFRTPIQFLVLAAMWGLFAYGFHIVSLTREREQSMKES